MKESRIENNKSFYGCFYLGSFDSGQSITVANALRRSLLSDCTGLAIISVKIENVQHEYSTLPGVRDSVLDILLNFKEIVLKKIKNPLGGRNGYKNKGLSSLYDKVGSTLFKPVVGYLKVKGPGIIRAKNIRLPPFIQCVDPNQYIATLAEDGILNVKFVIMEGKSYYIQKLSSVSNSSISGRYNAKTKSSLDSSAGVVQNKSTENSLNIHHPTDQLGDPSNYWTITKKRQNLLKQLKEIMHMQSNNTFTGTPPEGDIEEKYITPSAIRTPIPVTPLVGGKPTNKNFSVKNLIRGVDETRESPRKEFSSSFSSKTPNFLDKNTNTEPFNENSKQLNIDAVFSPVTKVNYVIEGFDNYIMESFNEKYKLIENLTSFLDSAKFLETNFPYFNKHWNTEKVEENSLEFSSIKDKKTSNFLSETVRDNYIARSATPIATDLVLEFPIKKSISKNLLDYITNLSTSDLSVLCTPEGYSHYKGIGIPSSFSESIMPSELNIESFVGLFESGVNVSPKQVVLLEIWTNGSLHPRDALLMAFKNLSYTFSPEKIKMTNPIFSTSTSYKKIIENLKPIV